MDGSNKASCRATLFVSVVEEMVVLRSSTVNSELQIPMKTLRFDIVLEVVTEAVLDVFIVFGQDETVVVGLVLVGLR